LPRRTATRRYAPRTNAAPHCLPAGHRAPRRAALRRAAAPPVRFAARAAALPLLPPAAPRTAALRTLTAHPRAPRAANTAARYARTAAARCAASIM